MSVVSTVAFNITELKVNFTIDLALALGRCKGSKIIIFPYQNYGLKTYFSLFLLQVIGAAVIGTSKIVGEKIKIKLLVQSQYCCFVNFINVFFTCLTVKK
jgi:hypothetical protein